MSYNSIKEKFKQYKINQLQLDPYGICNAKCWFCPVKYLGNPISGKKIMDISLINKILKNFVEERDKEDGLVDKSFSTFFTAHYNEILLYPHFEDLLKICQNYNLSFVVLSNGIPLTPDKVDLILKYPNVINSICLNIPGFEPEIWSLRSGINIKQYDKLISNISYAVSNLKEMVQSKRFSIQINGVTNRSFIDGGGIMDKGDTFPNDMELDNTSGEQFRQRIMAMNLFPEVHIYKVSTLVDRAGLLDDVISNKSFIKLKQQNNKKIIGCNNGLNGGRTYSWVHVNSDGKVFLCCNDYHMEIQFGDFKTQELKDFWGSEYHINKLEESFDGICKNCLHAVYE